MDDDRKKGPGGKGPRAGGKGGYGRPGKPGGGGKPFRSGDGPRPGRPPREAAAGERPARKFDGERPARKFDGERPAPKFDGERPARKFDGERPARKFDGERPARKFDGERPPRKFDGERPPRRFEDRAPRAETADTDESERIAKRLARAGISSRRDAEELIAAGRIKVNGKVLESPAFNVTPKDRIELDGTEIPAIERTRLFLFHKPAGIVTTNRDPEGRRTVFDALPEGLPRLMTVGRLDINTEGLLLLTNDGGLSRMIELPATGWLRRYRVRVHGKVDEQALADLRDGIAVDGTFYGAIEASLDKEQGSNAWLTIGLREGKNREVKNVLGALGLEVARLIRISYGPFQLAELPEGHIMEVRGRTLRDQLGERLIEESGANFEADINKPFSNKPVRRDDRRRSNPDERQERPLRTARPLVREGEGGLIKNFRRDRDRKREDTLDRLSTTRPERPFGKGDGDQTRKPRFGDKPAGRKPFGKPDRDETPAHEPGGRRANVWMAPGARPASKLTEDARKPRAPKPGGFKGPPKGKPRFEGGKPKGDIRSGGDRPGGSGPRGPRPGGPRQGRGKP